MCCSCNELAENTVDGFILMGTNFPVLDKKHTFAGLKIDYHDSNFPS